MASLNVIRSGLAEYFQMRVQEKVHELLEPMSSEQIWQRRGFDEAIATAIRTISTQSDRDWSMPYDAERADGSTRFGQVLACAGHAYHHVGQIIYLQKELLRQR